MDIWGIDIFLPSYFSLRDKFRIKPQCFMDWLGERFLMFSTRGFGDLSWLWFDHHTVTGSCMHARFLRLRGEGTSVLGAPLSEWRGDVLSVVISSPVPSIRLVSVVSECVREIGRCLFVWWDYLSSPPFPQRFYRMEIFQFPTSYSKCFCVHKVLINKFGKA